MVVITAKDLLPLFENFVETLNMISQSIDTTFEKLSSQLLQKERWRTQFGRNNSAPESAFAAKYKGKYKQGGTINCERASIAIDSGKSSF